MNSKNRILVVTNDFPPRQGGIETFAFEMVRRFDPADVIVYTSAEPGAVHHDAQMPFRVIRDLSRMLLPARRMARTVQSIAVEHGCDRVWFAAAAPLSSLACPLRTVGVHRIVASGHGHETWWAKRHGPDRAQGAGDCVCCETGAQKGTGRLDSSAADDPRPPPGHPTRVGR